VSRGVPGKRSHHPVVGDLGLAFEAPDITADGLRITAHTGGRIAPGKAASAPAASETVTAASTTAVLAP
jgi:hypothetical protein